MIRYGYHQTRLNFAQFPLNHAPRIGLTIALEAGRPACLDPEVEFSRKHFEILSLGLEGQVLDLEGSSPRNLPCSRLENSTIFLNR